jgi:hypothetical protein
MVGQRGKVERLKNGSKEEDKKKAVNSGLC